VITYCTNIHPGESWQEAFENLRLHIPAVKSAVSPHDPFPVGLRLSSRASLEIGDGQSALFAAWLAEQGLFVPTINGFPYGAFHSSPVKERVYLPDWRTPERVEYTKRLAGLLDAWLPEAVTGSISTVPVGFRPCIGEGDLETVRANLLAVLEHLDQLRQRSGRLIVLALEPEAGCYLESCRDVVDFFRLMAFPHELAQGIGLCYDCCHQAVQFEDPASSLALLAGSGIAIPKVQVSSALRLKDPDRESLAAMGEPCYLHQVVIRSVQGELARYDDLPQALRDHSGLAGDEWRIHFHVPVFEERMDAFHTTRFFIPELLPLLEGNTLLEVETYSWNALPSELRTESVTRSIIREIQWLRGICA
jgi:hypothetical protein